MLRPKPVIAKTIPTIASPDEIFKRRSQLFLLSNSCLKNIKISKAANDMNTII